MTKKETYAIIKTQGKQFGVKKGEHLSVDQINVDGKLAEVGSSITFNEVLFVSANGSNQVGAPLVSSASVKAKVIGHYRDKKVMTFKKITTHGYTKKQGHRQYLTKLLIEDVVA